MESMGGTQERGERAANGSKEISGAEGEERRRATPREVRGEGGESLGEEGAEPPPRRRRPLEFSGPLFPSLIWRSISASPVLLTTFPLVSLEILFLREDRLPWHLTIQDHFGDAFGIRNRQLNLKPIHIQQPLLIRGSSVKNELDVFRASKCVKDLKVNPDSPQKQVRLLTLEGGKTLLTPQPRLRTGFFSIVESHMLTPSTLNEACTSVGVAKYGRPIGLDEKIKVDLIVIGSVAVDPNTGARLGKGEGFAELEYGMLRYMGAIDDSTPVVTSVHDQQLVDDIPVEKLLIHDVPVDIICTPTQVIFTRTQIPKPQGIYWDKLSTEKLGQIRVLRELKRKIEEETGQKLPSGPSEKLPPTAQRRR
ncbi:hypothetical protein RHGRI_032067 [Rhododendron griersonianum]|uniref:5-formyltetrahydrofolate cyclo-ligase n=1 Tax=Rhododendron griersonianum TaxID=479676 RepID=A0AAV6IAJ4_9ERIC|nr:hypothetical protein RHGRI_032067 [Rhododendron griersonianum]